PHAADRRLLLEHDHVEPIVTQHPRGDQTGDPGTDHANPIAALVGHGSFCPRLPRRLLLPRGRRALGRSSRRTLILRVMLLAVSLAPSPARVVAGRRARVRGGPRTAVERPAGRGSAPGWARP